MKTSKKIIFSIIFISIIFLTIESIGYFLNYKFDLEVARFGVPMLVDRNNVIKDSKLLWKFKPDNSFNSRWAIKEKIRINKQGWRDTEFIVFKPKNEKRILMIGDSSTFGYRRNANEIFANILEDKLNKKKMFGFNWNVMNFGVPGYSTFQGKTVLTHYALKYKPDYLVTMFGINDSRFAPHYDYEYDVKSNDIYSKLEPLLQKTFTYKILFRIYYLFLEKKVQKQKQVCRVPIDRFKKNILFFYNTSLKYNFVYIPMTTPYNPDLINTDFVKNVIKYNNKLREICKNNNIKYIDISKIFLDYYQKNNKSLVWDSCHPDELGNKIIAEKIFEFLQYNPVN